MTALPSLDACGLQGTGLSIWNELLKAESTTLKEKNAGRDKFKYDDPLIGIRSAPYSRILLEITLCIKQSDDEAIHNALVELGLRYRNYILRVFRFDTEDRPTPSRYSSRPSFDVVKERILEDLGKVPQTKKNVKKQALLRDGYRCAISGVYDMQSCYDIPEIRAAVMALDKPMAVETQVAHIFPGNPQDDDEDYAAAVFAILELFGHGHKAEALYGSKINGFHNVITMAINLHSAFESFNLWLEPVRGQENTYDVRGKLLYLHPVPIPSRVTFSVDPSAAAMAKAANKEIMLPDPILIAIRAACTRVANLSGATEQADRIRRELEDSTVLADDGSMAGLLASRLSIVAPRFVDVH